MATSNQTENKSLAPAAEENKALPGGAELPEPHPEPNRAGNVAVVIAHPIEKGRIAGVEKDYKPGDKASLKANVARQLVADGVARYGTE